MLREVIDSFFSASRRRDLELRYRSCPLLGFSVGSVRDFCDSVDHLGPLATTQGDMKDLQRSWTFKALLSSCPQGAKLLEIGAGEPIVAGLLSRFGYDVTIFDAYEGYGNGPRQFETFCREYPDLTFRREYLNAGTDLRGETYNAIYSISVLEHIPLDEFSGLGLAIRRAARNECMHVHCIDHVTHGQGANYHIQMLTHAASMLSMPMTDIYQTLQNAETDPETYFLSAEGHNQWRGATPYDEFPMRRCISAQIVRGRDDII